jgi:hypothetical protein
MPSDFVNKVLPIHSCIALAALAAELGSPSEATCLNCLLSISFQKELPIPVQSYYYTFRIEIISYNIINRTEHTYHLLKKGTVSLIYPVFLKILNLSESSSGSHL